MASRSTATPNTGRSPVAETGEASVVAAAGAGEDAGAGSPRATWGARNAAATSAWNTHARTARVEITAGMLVMAPPLFLGLRLVDAESDRDIRQIPGLGIPRKRDCLAHVVLVAIPVEIDPPRIQEIL